MTSRTIRLVVVAVLVGALLGTPTSSARSTTLFTAFVGSAVTVGTGLGYPGLTLTTETNLLLNGTPMQTMAHLFDGSAPQSNCLTLPDLPNDGFTNCHWTFDHVRSVSLSSIMCLGGSANLAKSKSPIAAPSCSFGSITTVTLPNTISGHCGQNSGQMTIQFSDFQLIGLTKIVQHYLIDAHFISTMGGTTDGHMIMTGHVTKVSGSSTQRGLVVAVLDQQNATPLFATSNESCLNKTARTFIFVGVLIGYTN